MKKQLLKEWLRSLSIGFTIFVAFSIYLFLRRGYYNLYIVNKVFGSTSAVLAGMTLLLGKLATRFDVFDRYVVLRKPLGLLALVLALAHVAISLFFLPARFPLSWYLREIVPIAFGALAVLLWLYLAWISRTAAIKRLGANLWRQRQSLGARVAFVAVLAHLVIQKYPGWIRWWQGQVKASPELAHPQYPPASLFVFVIILGILFYRGFFLGKRK